MKLFATLVATIKEPGKSPGMTRAMKSGRKKKVKILSPKTWQEEWIEKEGGAEKQCSKWGKN